MKHKSIWKLAKRHKKRASRIAKETDVLIIGGGIAGIMAAYFLKDSGLKVALIDKGEIGNGVTSCSTGKLTYLQGNYRNIATTQSKEDAKLYLHSQREAIRLAKHIIKKENIDCNFEEVDSYLFSSNKGDEKELKKEAELLEYFGIPFLWTQDDDFILPATLAFKVEDTAVFHPVKFVKGIATKCPNVEIIEYVTAKEITKHEDVYFVKTDHNLWKTKELIVTTHYPFFLFPGTIPFKTHLERSYLIASEVEETVPECGISVGKETLSYRFHKDDKNYLLFASESHKMTNHIDYEKRYDEMEEKFRAYFPYKMEYEWMTHDVVTDDSIPYIGMLKDHLFIATGFNKWGMTNGILAGKVISDLLLERSSPYQELLNPKRRQKISTLLSKRSLSYLELSTLYVRTTLIKNHFFYRNAYVINENGTPYGIYIDEKGIEHKVYNKCPHMHCNLIFNSNDKTWDCPCHGSRFTVDGDLLQGPSTTSIKIKDK